MQGAFLDTNLVLVDLAHPLDPAARAHTGCVLAGDAPSVRAPPTTPCSSTTANEVGIPHQSK